MMRQQPKLGKGVVLGKAVRFGKGVIIWNYVVIEEGTKIGDRTRVGSFCDVGKNVIIGKNCNIQAHVTISNGCKIGNNVFIGPNSTILNDRFPYTSNYITPPIICDSVIIGGGAVILPKITIGKNSVIAAGSVVTKDVPPGVVAMGVPARKTMTRKQYEAKKKAFLEGET